MFAFHFVQSWDAGSLSGTFLADHGLGPSLRGDGGGDRELLGALLGGVCCGTVSERFGRKKTIILAALLAIPMIPLWAWTHTAVMLAVGGFLMQFMVQGAWGIIPAHHPE